MPYLVAIVKKKLLDFDPFSTYLLKSHHVCEGFF